MIKQDIEVSQEFLYDFLDEEIVGIQHFPVIEKDNSRVFVKAMERAFKKFDIEDVSVKIKDVKLEKASSLSNYSIYSIFSCKIFSGKIAVTISEENLNVALTTLSNTKGIQEISADFKSEIFDKIIMMIGNDLENGDVKFYEKTEKLDTACCIDVEVSMKQQIFGLTILMSKEAYVSWNNSQIKKIDRRIQDADFADKVALNLSMIIGESRVSKKDFASLVVGDCLLFNWGRFPSKESLVQIEISNIPIIQGKINKDKEIEIESFMMIDKKEIEEQDKNDAEKNNNVPIKDKAEIQQAGKDQTEEVIDSMLGGVDVIVKVEAGSISKTLKEIASLTPGNVIKIPFDGSMRLKINGKTFARGRIVSVGEAFGVQILKNE